MALAEDGQVIDRLLELAAPSGELPAGGDFREHLAAALGGEFAIVLDGPLLPLASWRAVVEVYDAARFNRGMQALVKRFNQSAEERGEGGEGKEERATWSEDLDGAYPVYRVAIRQDGAASVSFAYAMAAGYLIAAPDAAAIERLLRTFRSGNGLATAPGFKELLPSEAPLGLSAFAYAPHVDKLLGLLPRGEQDDEQRAALVELRELVGPALLSVLARPNGAELVLNSAGTVTLPELAVLASLVMAEV